VYGVRVDELSAGSKVLFVEFEIVTVPGKTVTAE
jgi:hypothetical protein